MENLKSRAATSQWITNLSSICRCGIGNDCMRLRMRVNVRNRNAMYAKTKQFAFRAIILFDSRWSTRPVDSNESENSRLSFDRFTRDSSVGRARATPVGSFQLRKFEVERSVGGTCWSAARSLLSRLPFIAIRLLGHLDHVIHVASVGGRHFARARESTSFDINIGDTRRVYSGFPRYFPEPGTLLHLDVVTIAISTHGTVHCRSSLDRSSSSFSISLSLSPLSLLLTELDLLVARRRFA